MCVSVCTTEPQHLYKQKETAEQYFVPCLVLQWDATSQSDCDSDLCACLIPSLSRLI